MAIKQKLKDLNNTSMLTLFLTFNDDERETAIKLLQEIYNQYDTVKSQQKEEPEIENSMIFFKNLLRSKQNNSSYKPILANQTDSYIYLPPEDSDSLQWWKSNQIKYPIIAAIAFDYLALQATSVPCERVFSIAKNTISLLRNRIFEETACASLFKKPVGA